MSRARSWQVALLLGLGLASFSLGRSLAAAVVEMVQHGRAFDQPKLHIHAGDVVRFTNKDEFDHQVYVQSPGFNVDTDESEPGQNTDVHFTTAGTFEVRCHIHPRMHLTVTVD